MKEKLNRHLLLACLLVSNQFAAVAIAEQGGGWLDPWLAPYRTTERVKGITCPPGEVTLEQMRRDFPDCRRSYVAVRQSTAGDRRADPVRAPRYTEGRGLRLRAIKDRAQLINEVQLELLTRGYYRGDVDGVLGPDTLAAVKAFQQDVGIPVTGSVDLLLLEQFERRALVTGSSWSRTELDGESVIGKAQLALSRLGYYGGPIDGVLNPATRLAIRHYRSRPRNQWAWSGYPQRYEVPPVKLDETFPADPVADYGVARNLASGCGLAAYRDGYIEDALRVSTDVLRSAAASEKDRACAFFARGLAHLASQNAQAAVRDFKSFLRIKPTVAEAFFNRAVAYRRAGQPGFARRDYRAALQLDASLAANADEAKMQAALGEK